MLGAGYEGREAVLDLKRQYRERRTRGLPQFGVAPWGPERPRTEACGAPGHILTSVRGQAGPGSHPGPSNGRPCGLWFRWGAVWSRALSAPHPCPRAPSRLPGRPSASAERSCVRSKWVSERQLIRAASGPAADGSTRLLSFPLASCRPTYCIRCCVRRCSPPPSPACPPPSLLLLLRAVRGWGPFFPAHLCPSWSAFDLRAASLTLGVPSLCQPPALHRAAGGGLGGHPSTWKPG